ncbi:hypothetical protein EDD22DRAFT_845798 [Suillus occidentalis]|nr:hypothetical protein EDD22DRAFT_845798 [Suillus occidentalis]
MAHAIPHPPHTPQPPPSISSPPSTVNAPRLNTNTHDFIPGGRPTPKVTIKSQDGMEVILDAFKRSAKQRKRLSGWRKKRLHARGRLRKIRYAWRRKTSRLEEMVPFFSRHGSFSELFLPFSLSHSVPSAFSLIDFTDYQTVVNSAIDSVYRAIFDKGKCRKAVKKGETGEIMMKDVNKEGWKALEGGWCGGFTTSEGGWRKGEETITTRISFSSFIVSPTTTHPPNQKQATTQTQPALSSLPIPNSLLSLSHNRFPRLKQSIAIRLAIEIVPLPTSLVPQRVQRLHHLAP